MTYDVLGVDIESGVVRVMSRDMDAANAEAFVRTARLLGSGAADEFYAPVMAGMYQGGEKYHGRGYVA